MTTTISRVLYSYNESTHALLRKWCEQCASDGGSFSIDNTFDSSWFTVYTIKWPDTSSIPSEAMKDKQP